VVAILLHPHGCVSVSKYSLIAMLQVVGTAHPTPSVLVIVKQLFPIGSVVLDGGLLVTVGLVHRFELTLGVGVEWGWCRFVGLMKRVLLRQFAVVEVYSIGML